MLKRHFTIIDRYISKELLLTWLAVTLVLMLILLSGTLARLLGKAAEGSIPGDAVWPLLMFTGARYLILLVPLSLYLGVLLNFSRLYKDNEMAALGACGVGLKRLYRPLLIVAIPATLLLAYLTLFVMPWVSQQAELLKLEIENQSQLSGLAPGRFNEANNGEAILFLQRQSDDGHVMHNVFMHQTMEEKSPSAESPVEQASSLLKLPSGKGVSAASQARENIESASSARRYRDEQGRQFILFENGYTYEGLPGQADFRMIQYAQKGVYLPESEVTAQAGRKQSLPTLDLLTSDRADYTAELHWRLSLPIACFLLAILALPLSYTTPRKGRYSKLALAILIYLIYSNLLGVGQSWVEKQAVPQWLGIWWVHGVVVLLIVYWWGKRAGGIKQLLKQRQVVKPV